MANVASFLLLVEAKPMHSSNAESQLSYQEGRKRTAAGPLPNG